MAPELTPGMLSTKSEVQLKNAMTHRGSLMRVPLTVNVRLLSFRLTLSKKKTMV